MRDQSGFRGHAGFTLIEVMVALVIMAFLSYFTSQSIQQALKAKVRVQKETDKNATLRDALKVMERDINYAFSYRSPYIELFNKVQEQRISKATSAARRGNKPEKNPDGTPNTAPNASAVDVDAINQKYPKKTDVILTKFMGEKDKLDFSSLSNIRISEDEMMDSQAEIGYFLKGCRRRSTQEQSSQCLWRRVANYIDEDIDKGGQETVLLENVDNFELRYLGPNAKDDSDWKDTWKSDQSGDGATQGVFPVAVEITVSVADPDSKSKVLKMTAVAAIRNPNNLEEAAGGANNQNGGQGGSTPSRQ